MDEIKQSISVGSAYIAVSESVKCDISEFYHVPAERITAVHHGVDAFFYPSSEDAARVGEKYRLGRYILDVNVLQVRKNHKRLLAAFALLQSRTDLPHHLVFVGRKGWGAEQVLDSIAQHGLQDRVHYLDYVPREDLRGLYSGAELVVNPSVCEGFGLPLLEAMACGTPIAASQATSFPEVGGDAVLYFDPLDCESIADALQKGLLDTALRRDLKARGEARVKAFSWEEAARQTVAAYRAWWGQLSGPT